MNSHPNRKKVRDWPAYLREFRKVRGLSQSQLAETLGLPKRTVENWEQDVNKPPAYLALALRSI